MIDIESTVFNKIAKALRLEFPDIYVGSEETSNLAKFPAVTIVEQDNSVVQRMRTLNIENAVSLMYEVQIFSNAIGGYKKVEAKEIVAVVNREFTKIGFTRVQSGPLPNLQDNTITRYVARYEAVADKDFWIYSS